MLYASNSHYMRALSDADVARWALKWSDDGVLNLDILQYVGFLALVAIPFIFAYWLGAMVALSSRFRARIRSGDNGMSILGFYFSWFIATAIINDIFFAVLFRGPIWAAYYHYVGTDSAVEIENAISLFKASAILFGSWS